MTHKRATFTMNVVLDDSVLNKSNVDVKQVVGQFRRKLSFDKEDTDNDQENPSPGDLPGEMFLLDNIKEEPETQSKHLTESDKMGKGPGSSNVQVIRMTSLSTSSSGVSSQSANVSTKPHEGGEAVKIAEDERNNQHTISAAINIDRTVVTGTPSNQSVGSGKSVPHQEVLENSLGSTSLEEPISVMTLPELMTRAGETSLLGVIKQGTSVSSVSSIGSYSFTVIC